MTRRYVALGLVLFLGLGLIVTGVVAGLQDQARLNRPASSQTSK
jgi:hypothetical protein